MLLATTVAGATTTADLTVESATTDRTTARAGEQIAVSCEVTNNRQAESGSSRLRYYFSSDSAFDSSDTYLNYDNVDVLAAGESAGETANVRVPYEAADGSYFIVLTLEGSSHTVALPITVGNPVGGADLSVDNVALAASSAMAGEVVPASAIVRNGGSETAAVSRLKYYLSSDTAYDNGDTYLNYDAVAELAASAEGAESANLRVPAGSADGLYYVLFVADQTDVVAESNEDNNVHAEPLYVGQERGLVLSDVAVPIAEVRAGETIAVSATVENDSAGRSDAGRLLYVLSSDTTLDAGDKQLSWDSFGALGAGQTSQEDADLRVTAATAGGAYHLLFVIEGTTAIASLPITVITDDPDADKADLVITGATLDADVVPSGEVVGASASVSNDGVIAAEPSRMKYYLSFDASYDAGDRYLNYDNVGALAAAASSPESANLRIPADVADGPLFILFVADATSDVDERYESNNVVVLPLTVGQATAGPVDDPDADLPDLFVSDAAVVDTAIMAGERASLSALVENIGDFAAAASKVKYYLSRDDIFDAGDDYVGYDNVPALLPGETSAESATPLIPAEAAHGSWHLLLVSDATDDVAETFESNNVGSVPITVVVDNPSLDAADLLPDAVIANKSTVGAGYKIDVDTTVRNVGTQPSDTARIKYYLSLDTLYDTADDFLAYRDVEALAVGGDALISADMRIPMSAQGGAAFILIVVDSGHTIVESYESNNVAALSVHIGSDTHPTFPYACPSSVFTDPSLLAKSTVASFNALRLGHNNNKDMTALACIVSHFDVTGLVEIYKASGVTDLEAELETLTGEDWSSHVSAYAVGNENGREFYGYVWRDAAVSMTGSLGFFDEMAVLGDDLIKREPYAASFDMGGFDFSLVLFHLQYGNTLATRRFEAQQLAHVYSYFQGLDGAEQDILIGGDFNLPGSDAAFTLIGVDGIDFTIDPEQKTTIGAAGLANSFDNIFYPSFTSELSGSGAHDYTNDNHSVVLETVSDHIPVWGGLRHDQRRRRLMRTSSILILAAGMALSACAVDADDTRSQQSVAMTSIEEGSAEEAAVLALVNDAATDVPLLDIDVGLDKRAANNIISYRDEVKPFDSIGELDGIRYVGPSALSQAAQLRPGGRLRRRRCAHARADRSRRARAGQTIRRSTRRCSTTT